MDGKQEIAMERTSDFLLAGYEDLEISTQLVICAAKRRGIKTEILDRSSHFLRLSKDGLVQYVKEATKTTLDTYMTFLIMENKYLTRLFLEKAGLRLPEGRLYNNCSEAWQQLDELCLRPIVVKPTTTNFGIGITMFEKGASAAALRRAIELAFDHSPTVLVEEFVPGREYRFLVLGGETVAVCNRLPANVLGDGSSTIKELIEKKNSDPFRGEGHRTPLEKITLGTIEQKYLQKENLHPHSRLEAGRQLFLRGNSNVSTGGDSIDCSDAILPQYKRLAERAAVAVNAKICGVDMIISDIQEAPQKNNHAFLELNFNPVLYIHQYPYQGTPRPVTEQLLDLLGF